MYSIKSFFVFLISLIHDNKDDLSLDVGIAFGKFQMIKHKDRLKVSEADINRIFDEYVKISWDLDKILTSRFSLGEIIKLIDLGVSMDELYNIIEEFVVCVSKQLSSLRNKYQEK